MKTKNEKLTNSKQKTKTQENINEVNRLKKGLVSFDSDDMKSFREKSGTCKVCYYLKSPTLVMNAFWDWNCSICLQDQPPWPNSATPKCCQLCSKKYNVCPSCTGDSDLETKDKNLDE